MRAGGKDLPVCDHDLHRFRGDVLIERVHELTVHEVIRRGFRSNDLVRVEVVRLVLGNVQIDLLNRHASGHGLDYSPADVGAG